MEYKAKKKLRLYFIYSSIDSNINLILTTV